MTLLCPSYPVMPTSEIAAILISFEKHNEWQSKEVKIRPKSGSMLLYSRKKVRYRRDGYCWKKRKDGKTTREDHMKLKVQGTECIYGCYVHSAILPTFHRRCYWLLQNPDIVLVHYLNVPYPDDNKLAVLAPSLALWGDKKEWTKDELVSQLKPMFYSEEERDLNNELEISTAEKVEAIVAQLMEKQRAARDATLTKQLECGCPDSTCADGKTCSHPMRRITAANVKQDCNTALGLLDNNNQVSSTTGSGMLLATNSNGTTATSIHHRASVVDRIHQGHSSPLVLSLSQIHSAGGLSFSQIQDGTNLLILNNPSSGRNSSQPSTSVSMVTNFKCAASATMSNSHQQQPPPPPPPLKQYHHPRNKLTLKHESTDANQMSCCRMTSSSNAKKVGDEGNARNGLPGMTPAFSNSACNGGKSDIGKDLNSVPVTAAKSMGTSGNSGGTILILNSSSGNRANSMSSVVPGSNFFNETLDLSQEDIQRTLSANMPLSELTPHRRSSHSKSPSPTNSVMPTDVMVPEINPMELIDSPPTVVDDDVFVNLDAFDMLSDFPELEILDNSGNNSNTVITQGSGNGSAADGSRNVCVEDSNNEVTDKDVKDDLESPNVRSDFREGPASITDYSPEWAYPEGGVKVLVTGPWYSSTSRYTVLFDSFPVPTMLVQSGVLRCFCPAHEVGLATVQVACEGFVISNSVMFEYKRPPHDDSMKLKEPKLEVNENLLKFTLLQRLEAVDGCLHIKQEPGGGDMSDAPGLYHQGTNFEERMVNYCQEMTNRQWRAGDESSHTWMSGLRGMTLLHLAASLGYARLVCTMLHWRAENSSLLLETEVDALSQDDEGFTPLMWACGRGHRETALVLYRWNHTALHIHNSFQQTAVSYAKSQGQIALANEIEKLEESREEANMTLLSNTTNNLDRLSELDITPSGSPTSSMTSLNSSKSHDGIFLRPDPIAKTDSKYKYDKNLNSSRGRSKTASPTIGILETYDTLRLVKRPSVDSGINLGSSQYDNQSFSHSSLRFKTFGIGETPKLSSWFFIAGMCRLLGEVTTAEPSSTSPTNEVENIPEDDIDISSAQMGTYYSLFVVSIELVEERDEQEVRVLTLAEQIIAAIPERIKNEIEEMQLDSSPPDESSLASDCLSDALVEPFLDEPSSSYRPQEFNFEFSDHNYRYYDVTTPSSSLSPASSSLQSPSPGFPLDSPSPPPTTQDFCEFFQASGSIFEKDFSNLTLSDKEQRELYEAAKIIQKAYRSYKGRKKLEEDKERAAAILIQNYYRRYKQANMFLCDSFSFLHQYAYFKQMTRAAMVIQNGYRSYCEHKRFKKSQEAAVCIQNYYRHYKEQGEARKTSRETTPSTGLKLQKERILVAEKEKQDVRQSSQDARRKSQSQDNSVPNNRCRDKNIDNLDS
ncbi:hypothetical protein RUM44_002755 [Polyplax serrata]|uniref:CG-1 domain-containing protein n=1 Tax=Polyplax serrata TaxID=468196 RepID=A0ABR1AGZ6_POLSC